MNNTSTIIAKGGERILVDSLSYDFLTGFKWYIEKDGEPRANIKINQKAYRVKMKTILKNCFGHARFVFYKNKNALDNRIENLTFCENEIRLDENCATMFSPCGQKSVVFDACFLGYVLEYSWSIKDNGYAYRVQDRKNVYLHNLIMNLSNKEGYLYVDHIDRNPSNNKRENLRVCTNSQNQHNKAKANIQNPSSIYKGVSWDTSRKLWRARASLNFKEYLLGYTDKEVVAAQLYNSFIRKHHGEFAVYNNVPQATIKEIQKDLISRRTEKHTDYTGISYSKRSGKWQARYSYEGNNYHIGTFNTELEAAEAYNEDVLIRGFDKKINNISKSL